jgi:hypothetical protein
MVMFREKTPRAPLALMTFGIVPFAVFAGLILYWRDQPIQMQNAGLWLTIYSAVILSFLGGVRWGVEIALRERPRWGELVPSIMGSLIGWGGVVWYFQTLHQEYVLAGMAGALLLHYFYDILSPELPHWYRKLRIWPTLGAIASLALGAALFGWA